jgi:hypothetical protein
MFTVVQVGPDLSREFAYSVGQACDGDTIVRNWIECHYAEQNQRRCMEAVSRYSSLKVLRQPSSTTYKRFRKDDYPSQSRTLYCAVSQDHRQYGVIITVVSISRHYKRTGART